MDPSRPRPESRRRALRLGAVACTVAGLGTVVAGTPARAAGISFTQSWTHTFADTGSPVAQSSPDVAQLPGGAAAVVGDRAGNIYAYYLNGGGQVPGWPFSTGGVAVDSTPSVTPTAGSAYDTVFVGVGNAGNGTVGGYQAINPTGTSKWFVPVNNPPTDPYAHAGVQASMAIGNLQGAPEVVAGSLGEEEYALDAQSGGVLSGFPWYQADSMFSSPALADLYHNGQTEIVEGGDSSPGVSYGTTYTQGGHLRVLRPTGNAGYGQPNDGLVCQYDTDQVVQSSPAVGEFFDGTQTVGMVFGTGNYWSGASTTNQLLAVDSHCNPRWATTLDGVTQASPALADVLGNGNLQVVEGTFNNATNSGTVWVLDGASGQPVWHHTIAGGMIFGGVATADLTGQGYQDVIVASTAGLQILDGKTGAVVQTVLAGIGLQNTPLVTNDPNGTIGITVAGYNGLNQGVIYHFAMAGSHGSVVNENGAWPMFHHDSQLTGDAGTPFTVQVPCNVPSGTPNGYYMVGNDGGVFNFGNLPFCGSMAAVGISQPMVGIIPTHDAGGYWTVAADGGVFAFGDAPFVGSLPGLGVQVTDVVGIVHTSDGRGYWMVGRDGGVFAFGDAGFVGSLPGLGVHVNDIVGIVPTSDQRGYWMVGADGGVFAFGDAPFVGSLPGLGVHVGNVVGIVPTSNSGGYWMAGSDGGVFAFGDAPFVGSLPGLGVHVNDVIGITATRDNAGYWMAGSDGGVFAFGDAGFVGSLPGLGVHVNDVVGITGAP